VWRTVKGRHSWHCSTRVHSTMGNEHGKEHDPNGAGVTTTQPATGEKVKKPGKKPKKPRDEAANHQPAAAAPSAGKSTMLKDIDTSSLKHAVTDPIEDYYTVTEKVLGRYVGDENSALSARKTSAPLFGLQLA